MSKLAQEIASRIVGQTHDDIPVFCRDMGIPLPANLAGSKREKTDQIVSPLSEKELATIALTIAEKTQDIFLDELGREVLERNEPKLHKVTRRDIADCFDKFGGLQGEASILEIVGKYWPLETAFQQIEAVLGGRTSHSLKDQIHRHMVRNLDWSVDELFQNIQAYLWSNARFFALIEEGLRPLARRGDEQTKLADALSDILKRDGFKLDVVGHESTFPIYKVCRLNQGVAGSPKNLIFASNGTKPVIGLADAINNDIKVLEFEKSCLIYERSISPDGLLWSELVDWWRSHRAIKGRYFVGLILTEPSDLQIQSEGRTLTVRDHYIYQSGEFFTAYDLKAGQNLYMSLDSLAPGVRRHAVLKDGDKEAVLQGKFAARDNLVLLP